MIRRTCTAVLATFLLLASVHGAHAHDVPPQLVFWGGYDAPTAHCQRAIGQAATRCFKQVLPLELQCRHATLGGAACDGDIMAARTAAIRRAAQVRCAQMARSRPAQYGSRSLRL